MLISTRARASAAFLIGIGLACTAISLFTCHWLDFEPYGFAKYSKGLFSQSGCTFYESSPSWNTATFVLMIIAFALEIIFILSVIITSFLPHSSHHHHMMKGDIVMCLLIFLTQTAAIVTYGISSTNYWNEQLGSLYNLSWSFWLVIPGAVFGLLAIGPLSHAITVIHRHGADQRF